MLTRRQREVCTLVARGLTDKQIARELQISPDTVDAHLRDAARRIPVPGHRRHKCVVWFYDLQHNPSDAA